VEADALCGALSEQIQYVLWKCYGKKALIVASNSEHPWMTPEIAKVSTVWCETSSELAAAMLRTAFREARPADSHRCLSEANRLSQQAVVGCHM
jgi:hypothetical protein